MCTCPRSFSTPPSSASSPAAACTEYLRGQAKELEAELQVVECVSGKPAVIMTLPGQDRSLQTLLLNSHTDVVPVFPEFWKYEPFSAHKDENGDIYGRGTQDMKCVGIMYLEALKRLKKAGHKFLRTIHLTFVPEEELGGTEGMGQLVKMDVFKNMNIGLALDEGYANTSDKMELFYGQRTPFPIYIRIQGQPGHGSQFIPNNAGEKLRLVINSVLGYRNEQERKLRENPELHLGDVTTVNLTVVEGGVQTNVLPAEIKVTIDARVAPSDVGTFEAKLQGWLKAAGDGITYEARELCVLKEQTCVDDGKNPWWDAFSAACKKENLVVEKKIFPASTDMKYVRGLGINALGFSPLNNTPRLLHDHNEFLNEKVFLRGIDIYYSIILNLANLKPY
ncbi:aminoacylase-1-like [Homarus americanus]|uniref:aminoacylase-1-like n=1 Tax=Homarus americanus TaxID=6706 RepID=UPI001C471137|nr:aminoacylase-1-like [Homarus americanus]